MQTKWSIAAESVVLDVEQTLDDLYQDDGVADYVRLRGIVSDKLNRLAKMSSHSDKAVTLHDIVLDICANDDAYTALTPRQRRAIRDVLEAWQ